MTNAAARTPPRTSPKPRQWPRIRYRLPSPPPDPSGLRVALAALDAEHEYDPDGDMVVGFRDFKRALAAAKRVRRCHAAAAPWEISALTHGQSGLLASVYERPYVRLRRVGRPRPSIIREAIRAVLAKDDKTPSRKVIREIHGMPGIVWSRDGAVRYRDGGGNIHDLTRGAFDNLVSQVRKALRLGR